MGSRAKSPLAIVSYLMMIIGVILIIASLFLFFYEKTKPTPWYYWLIFILGVALMGVGIILLVVALIKKPKNKRIEI